MTKYKRGQFRNAQLADVAEMYYLEELTQAEISRTVGMTRSAISRMLTEARQKGIVEITVHRPSSSDEELERALINRFNLLDAHVISLQKEIDYDMLLRRLGRTAADLLLDILKPDMICGVTWGMTMCAIIQALSAPRPIPLHVVQLVGVLKSKIDAFNAQALAQMMAAKLGGEGTYIYSPFIVENAETARSIMNISNVRETLSIGSRSDIALIGIGTLVDENFSTLIQGGHMSSDTLYELRAAGAVGDVSGRHFDVEGRPIDSPFHDRLICVDEEDLLAIPVRFGVAGGRGKAHGIIGALRGGYVNQLVTDSITAEAVLALENVAKNARVASSK